MQHPRLWVCVIRREPSGLGDDLPNAVENKIDRTVAGGEMARFFHVQATACHLHLNTALELIYSGWKQADRAKS